MLFLSRRVGLNTYGVVDTDDNVETVVSYKDLASCIIERGLKIAGVAVLADRSSAALSVAPYQLQDSITPFQVKTSLAYHVDIITYGTIITGIRIHSSEIVAPVRLRLSDYGDSCAAYIFRGLNSCSRLHKLTLVIDDKLSLADETFYIGSIDAGSSLGLRGIGVVFDMREVTDTKIVGNIYGALYNHDPFDVSNSIIDGKERKNAIVSRLWGAHS